MNSQLYWEKFWQKLRRSILWSSLLTIFFFVIYLPMLTPDQYWLSLWICLGYSVSILVYITLFYGLAYAYFFYQKGVTDSLPTWLTLTLGVTASSVGVLQGILIQSYLTQLPIKYSDILTSLMLGLFIALMLIFYSMYKEAKTKNQKLQLARVEAELHVFKNQMQPHFLFNSLNSLLELVETQSAEAPVMTQMLSDLYRDILSNSQKNLSDLQSEVGIIEKYLQLEKIRYGSRLDYIIDSLPEADKVFLPSLLLQTLVENAVKHGISHVLDRGIIQVQIQRSGSGFSAEIKNTGRFIKSSSQEGFGLKNSISRLSLLYGDKHNFSIEEQGEQVCTSFWFSGASS